MGIIGLFFPAAIMCYMRYHVNKQEIKLDPSSFAKLFVEYVGSAIIINCLIILGRVLIKGVAGNVYTALSEHSDFALKYIFLAVLLACVLPYAERYIRNNLFFEINLINGNGLSEKWKSFILVFVAVIFALYYLIRMFDNSVWGDEGLVVRMVRENWSGMLKEVAGIGHSPFHYAFAWVLVKLFGESGFIFHLSASLPYYLCLILSFTMIQKMFGKKCVLIFILFCSVLDSAITLNMEIRMYAWCQLFVLLAFITLYNLYQKQNNLSYVLLTVFSLGAVYSHYFALISIGILYIPLFIYSILSNRKNIWKVIVSGGLVLGLLALWMAYTQKIRGVVITNWNIGHESLYNCVEYIFYSKYSMPLLYIFGVLVLIAFLYDYHIIHIEKAKERHGIVINTMPKLQLNNEWIWIFSGILAVFGLIIAAKLFSILKYPIILLRYLYPSYIILWLLFAILLSKTKLSQLWAIALSAVLLISSFPNLYSSLQTEMLNNNRLQSTLAATRPEIDENDFIYTDIVHFAWTVEHTYYPQTPCGLFPHSESIDLELDDERQYWLFISGPISEAITVNLNKKGKYTELVVDCGYLGTGNIWVYKILPIQ